MAKIRTLKGEFFRNADISRGGLTAKVLAAGLVCAVADDDGRFKAGVAYLRGEIFTHDNGVDVAAALESLAHATFIRLYNDHGRPFGHVLNWKRHQPVPPSRYKPSDLPAPPDTKPRRHAPTERKHLQAVVSPRAGDGKEGKGIGSEGRGEEPGTALVLVAPQSLGPVEQVFEAWRLRWHPTAKLTSDRRAKVQARLREGWKPEDLIAAVTDGAAADPWADRHVAMNDDLVHLLKNGGTAEKFVELARTGRPLPSQSTLGDFYRQTADRIEEEERGAH